MKKFIIFLTLIMLGMAVYSQTATFPMKTIAEKIYYTDYTLTNTVADTFIFYAPRNYPATQAYSAHVDSTSGNHTNIAIALYGSLLGVTYTQIGSTLNYVTGFSPTRDTTFTIANTTANRYNYYKVIYTGTGTGVATIDWQRMQIWSAGELSDGVATLSAGSFSGLVNIVSSGTIDQTIATTTASGERGIDLSISHGTNALTGTLYGIKGNARVNVASASGSVNGGDFQAGNMTAGYDMSTVRGVYAGVTNKVPVGDVTWTNARGIEVNMDLDQGTLGNTNTITNAAMFWGLYNLPTAGSYATVTNGYGIYVRNDAVGGTGQMLDAAFYASDVGHSGGVKGWEYGIDFSGVGANSGSFGTADIKLANGEILSNSVDKNIITNGNFIIQCPTPTAINSTNNITAAQMIGGVITSTSVAATTLTTPTATAIMALIPGGGRGTQFDLIIDNSAGASTVTLALDASIAVITPAITGGNTLTVTTDNDVALFRFYFISATAAKCFRIY